MALTGHCIINGSDIYDEWGAFLTRGAEAGILQFPARKAPVKTEWPDSDMPDVDLDTPLYEVKRFSLGFFIKGETAAEFKSRWSGLWALLTQPELAIFIRTLWLTTTARYESCTMQQHTPLAATATVTFVMDEPLGWLDDSAANPYVPRVRNTGYLMDFADFGKYGIAVLRGSTGTIDYPKAKAPLLQTNSAMSGQMADEYGNLRFEESVITLKCVMRAEFLSDLIWNLMAFNQRLNAPGMRYIYAPQVEKTYWCSYREMTGMKITGRLIDGEVTATFDLTLNNYYTSLSPMSGVPDYGDEYNHETDYLPIIHT